MSCSTLSKRSAPGFIGIWALYVSSIFLKVSDEEEIVSAVPSTYKNDELKQKIPENEARMITNVNFIRSITNNF
jgi:hypothetical protein